VCACWVGKLDVSEFDIYSSLCFGSHQGRERNTAGDGEDQTSDKEQDIEFGRVDLGIDRKVSKDFLKLFLNSKLALDHDTQDLHEARELALEGDKSAMVARKCLAGRHQL
jgi:hypothetical protein